MPRASQPVIEQVFELTKLVPVQVPDPVAPAKRPVPPMMVKAAASEETFGSEVQVTVPVVRAVKESPLRAVNVATPVKDLTQEPAPADPVPVSVNWPRSLSCPLRLTVHKPPEESMVQEKGPEKVPERFTEDRAETDTGVDTENKARRTNNIMNRVLDGI